MEIILGYAAQVTFAATSAIIIVIVAQFIFHKTPTIGGKRGNRTTKHGNIPAVRTQQEKIHGTDSMGEGTGTVAQTPAVPENTFKPRKK